MKGTFLWDAAWPGTHDHRWSPSLVLSGRAIRPVYNSADVQAYRDVLVFADHEEVRSNRVDAQIANNKTKQVSCPWVNNSWEKKSKKKTVKYAPLRWELKTASFPCLQIEATQHHHWCTRGVVTGDGHYNVQDCREQK